MLKLQRTSAVSILTSPHLGFHLDKLSSSNLPLTYIQCMRHAFLVTKKKKKKLAAVGFFFPQHQQVHVYMRGYVYIHVYTDIPREWMFGCFYLFSGGTRCRSNAKTNWPRA